MSPPKPFKVAKGKSWGTSSPKKTDSETPEDSKKPFFPETERWIIDFCKFGHLLFHEMKKLKRLKKAFEETEETMPFIALRFRV
jgi:hypothetical protein